MLKVTSQKRLVHPHLISSLVGYKTQSIWSSASPHPATEAFGHGALVVGAYPVLGHSDDL